MKRYFPIMLLLCLVVVLPVQAQGSRYEGSARGEGSDVGLDDAVSRVRSQTQGRILSAETRNGPDGRVHHIRVLTNKGKVKRYQIEGRDRDERSGRR